MSFSFLDSLNVYHLSDCENSDLGLLELNAQLREAVETDKYDEAVLALKNGANPNYRFYHVINPCLVCAKSPEMISLLLQFGANPNFLIKNLNEEYGKPLCYYFLDLKRLDLLTALVSYKPCKLLNQDINHVLLLLMRSDDKESLRKNFNWESPKGICILSFMHASADLQEVVTKIADPLTWAGKQEGGKNNILVKLMLKHNYVLYGKLRNQNKLSDYSSHHNEIPGMVYLKWKLLMLMVSEGGLNSDIANLIALFIISSQTPIDSFRNYCQENVDLKIKMSDFEILHRELTTCRLDDDKYNFWKNNHYLSPSSFFRQVNAAVLRKEKGILTISDYLEKHASHKNDESGPCCKLLK